MIRREYVGGLIFALCMQSDLLAQEINVRQKFVDNLDKTLNLDKNKKLMEKDSVVILHYKAAVYQLYKKDEGFEMLQTLLVEKQMKKAKAVSWKPLKRSDTIYLKEGEKGAVINGNLFKTLYDLSAAATDKQIKTFKSLPQNPPSVLDLYVESIADGQYKFQEWDPFFLDDIEINGKRLDKILDEIFLKYDHWEKLEKLVKDNGYGVYRYSKYGLGVQFEYKANNMFKLINYPKEFPRVPQIKFENP